jgi:tetratricopeptide (TPR) repeat protein
LLKSGSIEFNQAKKMSSQAARRAWQYGRSALLMCLSIFWFTLLLAAQTPADAEAFRQASEAMRAGSLDEAGQGFAAIVKRAPAFAEAHFNLGLVREEQGRYEDAIASFKKSVTLKPRLRGANLFLGIAEFRLNHFDLAETAIQKETAGNPGDPNAWMWLGVVRLANDHPESAAEALDKAAKLAPENVDILYHRGRAHLLVSKDSYAKMFETDSRSWRVHQVMAEANAEADRHVDAVAEYEAAIKLVPTQPGLHEALGSEYRNLGKSEQAEAAFRRELEIDPYNVLAKYKLGVLTVEKGDGAKGKELIEAALHEKPDLLHADYNLGRAEMLLGDNAGAATHFERATKAPGSDPEVVQQAWYQLGIAYRRLRRTDEAQRAMATFQKLKDEAAESSQKALKRYQQQREATGEPVVQPEQAPSNDQTPNH